MNTLNTLLLHNTDQDIARAGEILRGGGLVAIPTETVYGLAANALDGQAVAKIFKAKGRPQDNPLIVHISELSQWNALVREIPPQAMALAKSYWPGPLTIILPKSGIIPDEVSAGLDTVAVRFPSMRTTRKIIDAAGVPLAAPSANLSGSPSPTCAKHTMNDMAGRIEAVLDGGDCNFGVESTVVTLAGAVPRLLRPGAVTPEDLREVLGEVEIDEAVMGKLKEGAKAASPGMKYKHYSPKAEVTIVKSDLEAFCKMAEKIDNKETTFALCFDGEERTIPLKCVTYGREDDSLTQSHRLFTALRELDEQGAEKVYARCPSTDGVGMAVYNRLLRAAGFNVIEL
ncbi:MAG: L-threonylcarbamoyladenylate synthase [Firmicutes bacterium]|nr:L-threonylcarbamoyladenylate synthase [Bacillota bacterium]